MSLSAPHQYVSTSQKVGRDCTFPGARARAYPHSTARTAAPEPREARVHPRLGRGGVVGGFAAFHESRLRQGVRIRTVPSRVSDIYRPCQVVGVRWGNRTFVTRPRWVESKERLRDSDPVAFRAATRPTSRGRSAVATDTCDRRTFPTSAFQPVTSPVRR